MPRTQAVVLGDTIERVGIAGSGQPGQRVASAYRDGTLGRDGLRRFLAGWNEADAGDIDAAPALARGGLEPEVGRLLAPREVVGKGSVGFFAFKTLGLFGQRLATRVEVVLRLAVLGLLENGAGLVGDEAAVLGGLETLCDGNEVAVNVVGLGGGPRAEVAGGAGDLGLYSAESKAKLRLESQRGAVLQGKQDALLRIRCRGRQYPCGFRGMSLSEISMDIGFQASSRNESVAALAPRCF